MRQALLIAFVLCLTPFSILNGRWGVYAYTWFALMRPDYLAWAAGNFPFSLILAVCALIGCLPYAVNLPRVLSNPFALGFLLLVALQLISTIVAVNPAASWESMQMFLRVVLMALLIPLVLDRFEYFREMMFIITVSMGLVGAKFGYGGLLAGGAKYYEGYGGFLADNNCAALAFAMVAPMCWYAALAVRSLMWRNFYWMLMAGSVAGIVWTHSRGGILALAAGMAPVLLRSKHKVKLLLALGVVGGATTYLVRETLFERWAAMNSETYAEDATASQRMMMWRAAIAMWRDYPVFGVGFGSSNFIALSPRYSGDTQGRVAHNTYLQVLADSGIFALAVYLLLMVAAMWYLGRSAKRWKKHGAGLEIYPRSILAALAAFAVGSVFLSRVTFDFYYILLMMVASWRWLECNGLLAEAGPAPARERAAGPLPGPPPLGWPPHAPQPAGGGRLQPTPGQPTLRSAFREPPKRQP